MSSNESAARKKRITEPAKRTSEDDHRRKRRNRTTQSCLNCHTSKRMCDRKRPCGRCTQLGLTGLCVYEVDDPNQRNDGSDEKTRLQKRVAELESVIRELKNKPHPRWVHALEKAKNSSANSTPGSSSPTRSASEESDSPSNGSPRIHLHPPTPAPSSRASPLIIASSTPSSSSSSFGTPSPIDTPSPLALSPVEVAGDGGYDLASLFSTYYPEGAGLNDNIDNLFDGLIRNDNLGMTNPDSCLMHHDRGHCGCLSDVTSYGVVLELSLRLRRAAEVLAHDAKHRASQSCPIHQRITDLDRRTSEALANVSTPTPNFSSYTSHAQLSQMHSGRSGNVSATVSPHSLHASGRWDYKSQSSYPSPPCEDSFMSWDPARRPGDWVQPATL